MRYKVENILSTDPDDPDKIRILSVGNKDDIVSGIWEGMNEETKY
jgi:hypothetical protein